MYFRDGGDLGEQLRAQLIDQLRKAPRLETLKHFVNQPAHGGGDSPGAERSRRFYIQPLQIQRHVQGPIRNIGQRRILIPDETLKRAAPKPQKFETLDSGSDLDGTR